METGLLPLQPPCVPRCSPFGGIPRNWKLNQSRGKVNEPISVPPSGGSLEIGNARAFWIRSFAADSSSPFGGIPRNWKRDGWIPWVVGNFFVVPPSGGSLEIGNAAQELRHTRHLAVPPSGGSLEIGNTSFASRRLREASLSRSSPFGGIPRNWKPES